MGRSLHLRLLLLVGLGALMLRLVHLQILKGDEYRRLAEQNRIRVIPQTPPRGLILDRRGQVLATNRTVYRLAVIPQDIENLNAVLERVSALTQIPPEKLQKQMKKEQGLVFMPATLVGQMPKEVALTLEEERWRLPGLIVQAEPIRHYPMGATACHLLGYLNQPTAEELPLLKRYGLRAHSLVGRTGIEEWLDPVLRGEPGGLMVEVNHRGRQVRTVSGQPAVSGERVMLTIDAQLESLIQQSFGSHAGAAVVLEPHTGEVLAMVSNPSFDPEAFVSEDDERVRDFLLDPDKKRPMMNRATGVSYPPGSIAKLVVGATALEKGVITPETSFECHGGLKIGDRVFHCWNRDGHGSMNLGQALMHSCNVYFMQVGRRLGLSSLLEGYLSVGFSRPTEWPMMERPGQVPNRRLSEGEVAIFAIGQSAFEITPLQAAIMASVFANGGNLVQPWILKEVGNHPFAPAPIRRRVPWSSKTMEAVRFGMREVVNNPEGTGRRALTPRITVAGKTGTAQTHKPGMTHGWFAGYCPIEDPKVAIAVVAEFGGSGGDLPTEIARTICEYVALPDTL